jgi:hypothetical protein
VFVCVVAAVTSAGAVTINGTDYVLFARCKLAMENGPLKITGNVAVNEDCGVQNGLMMVGVNNTINGTATANRMFLSHGSSITTCNFNESKGDATQVCGSSGPANIPITNWPAGIPLPIPVVNEGTETVVCPPECNPAPGSYKEIRANDNATLNLSTGTYDAKTLKVAAGATLNGNGAAVNLTGSFLTENQAIINDVVITSIKGQDSGGVSIAVIKTSNSAKVNNSIFYAPFAYMHLKTGGTYTNFEGIALLIAVEPITIEGEPTPACACIGAVADGGQTIKLSQGCHLSAAGNQFFVSTTCAIDANASCPGPGCIPATLQAGATDTNATLNKPAAPAGNYHVLVKNTGGAFCTAGTVPIP